MAKILKESHIRSESRALAALPQKGAWSERRLFTPSVTIVFVSLLFTVSRCDAGKVLLTLP